MKCKGGVMSMRWEKIKRNGVELTRWKEQLGGQKTKQRETRERKQEGNEWRCWTFLSAEILELFWGRWSSVEMHTCTQRDTSSVKQHSEVSAVNIVEGPGYISADQTLSNSHIFFPPSGDSQLSDEPSKLVRRQKKREAVKSRHRFQNPWLRLHSWGRASYFLHFPEHFTTEPGKRIINQTMSYMSI